MPIACEHNGRVEVVLYARRCRCGTAVPVVSLVVPRMIGRVWIWRLRPRREKEYIKERRGSDHGGFHASQNSSRSPLEYRDNAAT